MKGCDEEKKRLEPFEEKVLVRKVSVYCKVIKAEAEVADS